MKRGHTANTYRNIVKAFRKVFPEITIATDIIVGFPSETDQDFLKTIALIKETEPDIVNSSKYSARSGTEACKLKRLDSFIIKQRSECLHKLIKEIGAKRNSFWKGWKGNVIIDEIGENILQGRNYAYKPVLLPSECLALSKSSKFKTYLGDKVAVEISGYSSYSLTSSSVNLEIKS
jgi:threonylcarbamoyladenosine tRNA methylthiotransferase CDKAL1